MKLLAIVPFVFSIVFAAFAVRVFHSVIHPDFYDERIISFAVVLIELMAFAFCAFSTVWCAVNLPWGLTK